MGAGQLDRKRRAVYRGCSRIGAQRYAAEELGFRDFSRLSLAKEHGTQLGSSARRHATYPGRTKSRE